MAAGMASRGRADRTGACVSRFDFERQRKGEELLLASLLIVGDAVFDGCFGGVHGDGGWRFPARAIPRLKRGFTPRGGFYGKV